MSDRYYVCVGNFENRKRVKISIGVSIEVQRSVFNSMLHA